MVLPLGRHYPSEIPDRIDMDVGFVIYLKL